MKFFLILLAAGCLSAQEHDAAKSGEHAGAHEASEKYAKASDVEAEFVASDVFQSGTYLQPAWKGLGFESHWFHTDETHVGYVGAGWTIKLGEFKLIPGFGVSFGSNQFPTEPTLSIRWDYEYRWFVTQGMTLQGLRDATVYAEEGGGEHGGESHGGEARVLHTRPAISDGNHASVRWKRLTVGGTWEHIHFREEDEWKGGGRVAVRLLPRLSAVLYVFTPGKTEWRGGLVFHPRQKE